MRKMKILDSLPSCKVSEFMPKFEIVEKDGVSSKVFVEVYKHPYPQISYLDFSARSVIESGQSLSPAPAVPSSNTAVADDVSSSVMAVAKMNEEKKVAYYNKKAIESVKSLFNSKD